MYIDAEPDTSLEYHGETLPGRAYHFLRGIAIGNDRDMPADGESYAWISPTMAYSGSRSIGLRAYPSFSPFDRVEIRAVHGAGDGFALQNATTRYLGYAFMLHPQMDAPTGWLHVMQVWQRPAPDTAQSGKVPFTLSLTHDLRLEAVARTHLDSTVIWRSAQPISKGDWHTLVYELRPSYNGDGHGGAIAIWLDGVEVVRWVGDWGNPPEFGYLDKFDVRCGLYRQGQNNHTIIMYDDILYATTKEAATP